MNIVDKMRVGEVMKNPLTENERVLVDHINGLTGTLELVNELVDLSKGDDSIDTCGDPWSAIGDCYLIRSIFEKIRPLIRQLVSEWYEGNDEPPTEGESALYYLADRLDQLDNDDCDSFAHDSLGVAINVIKRFNSIEELISDELG